MVNVSTKYLELVQETARGWDLYIDVVLQDGTAFRLTKSDIDLGTLVFKGGATCSDTIQMGSTYSNSVEFRLINKEARFTGYNFYRAKVYPFVGLDLTGYEDYEYVPLGEFNILEPVKKFSTISIVCFDNMSLCNREFHFESMVFPTTPVAVFDAVVAQCGIFYADSLREQIQALDYQINSLLTNNPTCRDVLAGFGVMLLKNLRFSRDGILESFWYSDSGVSTTKQTRVGNSTYGDNVVTTTGVYVEDAYGNTFSVGTEVYPVELPTSPILQGSEMCTPILEAALAVLQSLSYIPATITCIGDPALQAGDIITHYETAIGDVTLPVMRLVYKFAGTETVESLGMNEVTLDQQSSTDKKLKKAFSREDKNRAELETKIEQTANEVLIQASETYATKEAHSELSVKVSGISTEVAQQEKTLEGVQTSLSQVQQSAGELSITIQQIIENGAERVTTKQAKYTLDDDGLHISKSGEEMDNKLDHTGMYVKRSGATMLQANNEGVIGENMTVRKFFRVGNHTRMEDYSDGSDTRRTAIFWIS